MKQATAQNRTSPRLLKNEDGVAIIAVMLILVVLTIMGIASTNVSNTEIQIAGSHAVYQQNFYLAEGAVTAGIEALEAELAANGDPRGVSGSDNQAGIIDTDTIALNINSAGADSKIDVTNHTTEYYIDYIGASRGSSLGVTSSKVHEFSLYGKDQIVAGPNKNSAIVINAGYLMAFK
jgi:Tfp pilus assembly protein PilX